MKETLTVLLNIHYWTPWDMVVAVISFEPGHSISDKIAGAPCEDSDQTADGQSDQSLCRAVFS